MPWCLEEINRVYRRLDVHFDNTLGESFYNPMLAGRGSGAVGKRASPRRPTTASAIFFGENETPAFDSQE